jgi:hypothetical protein
MSYKKAVRRSLKFQNIPIPIRVAGTQSVHVSTRTVKRDTNADLANTLYSVVIPKRP